ncbi:MAG: hypothetical protein ACFFG0_28210 [Candidatus Thorarchaeota archaeon]
MIIRSILKNLKNKKIDIYVRDLGRYGCFQGVLIDMTEEIIIVKSKYNKITYIPLSEIVIITEHDSKTEFIKDKLRDVVMVNSIPQQ